MSIRGLAGNNKGITLIELLIAVALTGMIMSLGYALYFFGTGSFERGTAQAQAQHNARLADEYLKAELRNALRIEIDKTGREGEFDGYFHLAEGSLIKSGERVTGNTLINLAVKIVNEGNRAILEYEIKSSDHNEKFIFTNRILLNNIGAAAFDASYNAFRSLDVLNQYVLYYNLTEAAPRYLLTMTSSPAAAGTATDITAGSPYAAGTTVNIRAVANAGFRFSHWTAPAGVFVNTNAVETTFTMPAQNVTVTANFVTANLWPDSSGFIYNSGLFADEWIVGFSEGGGSQSKRADHLYLRASQVIGKAERTYVSRQRVNLTNVREIRIEWENTGANFIHNQSFLVVSTNQNGAHRTSTRRLRERNSFDRETDTLSARGLTGDFFIRVHARENHTSHDRRSELRVYSIRLIYE
ncbi:MAG TPA: hypothetical protein DCQ14_05110 [Firmicutes bacterium]|nr:hypothetical protein [Bacillota bacterium]